MRAAPGMKVARVEDGPLLRGDARYLNDLDLGHAHVVFVRSSTASAHLLRSDTTAAAHAPEVIAVASAGQLDLPLRAQGIAQALYEQISYDESGNPLATRSERPLGP